METEVSKRLGFGSWEKAFPNTPCYTPNLWMKKLHGKEGHREGEEEWRFEFPSQRFI